VPGVLTTIAGVGSEFQTEIVDTGRLAAFLFFIALLGTFGFIRTSTWMIRKQVSWWPGNVSVGGTHVHHLVWGILLLMSMGYLGITFADESPWAELVAIGFGIGMGLTLDEFALWLNLEDVYWAPKGRQSIDAVIVTGSLLALSLLGLQFWIDVYEAVLVLLGVGGERLDGGETAFVLIPIQVDKGPNGHRIRIGRLTAALYGAGAALTLDEFALWLNLEDVYWEREGRASIDAVMLFGALISVGLWGGPFLRALTRYGLRPFRRRPAVTPLTRPTPGGPAPSEP